MNPKQIRAELNKIKAPYRCKNCSKNHLYIDCTSETPRCHLDNLRHRVGDRSRCEVWRSIKNILLYSTKIKNNNINPLHLSVFKLADYMVTDEKPKPKSNAPKSLQPQIPQHLISSPASTVAPKPPKPKPPKSTTNSNLNINLNTNTNLSKNHNLHPTLNTNAINLNNNRRNNQNTQKNTKNYQFESN